MNYYVKKDENIILFDTDLSKLKNTVKFIPNGNELEILSTNKDIIELNGKIYFREDVQQELGDLAKEQRKNEIIAQLDNLDRKRVRAVCEPTMKDDEMTWLEYYNRRISELRLELNLL